MLSIFNFTNRCPSGTDGKRCQTSPERCIGTPCMHGGMCNDYGSGLNCSCPAEFTGQGCQLEYDACEDNICQNGATCEDMGEKFKCICPPGFTGALCDNDIPDCLPNSCPPTAQCIDLTNDFYCKCPFNFTGEDCRKRKYYVTLYFMCSVFKFYTLVLKSLLYKRKFFKVSFYQKYDN